VPEPLDARERRELCDLLGDLGPDAPTLCEGWTTLDLAAHLVVRERRPTAAPGLLLGGPFTRLLDRATERELARGYTAVVERVRNGPPPGPFAVPRLRTLLNLNEYAVHHEDVRRANGSGPRTDRPDLQDALWPILRRGARLLLRSVTKEATVRLEGTGGEAVELGTGPTAVVTGEPLELSLFLFGRKGVAAVELSGDPAAIEVLRKASLGV
jgi:uncharacterized protein (TIGR03085 family)